MEFDTSSRFNLHEILDKDVIVSLPNGNVIMGSMNFFGIRNNNLVLKDFKEIKGEKIIMDGKKVIIHGRSWDKIFLK